jgi:hypothetical protein
MEKGIVVDGVVAQDNSQAASFWQIREVGSFFASGGWVSC